MRKLKTYQLCVEKWLDRCGEPCSFDVDESHHPNNYDCPRFQKMRVWQFYVKDVMVELEGIHAHGHEGCVEKAAPESGAYGENYGRQME
jgi:hypothetical protein